MIFTITVYFLYYEIFYKKDIVSLLKEVSDLSENDNFYVLLVVTIALIFVNLFLETAKWQFLISKLEKISFWKSLKAVLAGISITMFLPNRTGDYLGRIFVLEKADRFQAVLSTILGSLAQLLTTLLFGLISVAGLFPFYYSLGVSLYLWLYIGIVTVVLILIFVMIFAYVEFSAFTDILKRLTGREYKRIEKYAVVFSWYSSKDLFKVLCLSITRYLVFSFQFYLLLIAMGIPLKYPVAMLLIGMIYLLMTIIPTIALSELGIRGSVSIFVIESWFDKFGYYVPGLSIKIFSASTLLWFFNVAAPAFIGALFIFSLKFFRKT